MTCDLSIILGNQLFSSSLIKPLLKNPIFMCESDDLCTHFNYHKLKLIFFLSAMRSFKDELIDLGVKCNYYPLPENKKQLFIDVLSNYCKKHSVERIHIIEIEDLFFRKQLESFCSNQSIELIVYDSPMFLTSHLEFSQYINSVKKPFMKTFYESQRKKLSILIDDNKKPKGGKWSYDEENRKKTPKNVTFPMIQKGSSSVHIESVKKLVKKKFEHHFGSTENIWFPVKRDEVHRWCDEFISSRFSLFGDYEDAIDNRSDFLFHSGLSPFLNCGLITPKEILDKIKEVESLIPINSYEGFVRQVIGWREFIRGIYNHFDDRQQNENFFNHKRKLNKNWYNATTGIDPLDDAINQVDRLGYTHHINRLMVIGNVMLLCQVDPKEVYKWFMEFFIDSSDWVMGPNVFGMSQFSDGGIFATKPYFSGSNYIRKMSHYPKKEWCKTMDALYWRFIDDNKDFFMSNFRMKFMVSKINSFEKERIKEIHTLSNAFINKVTS